MYVTTRGRRAASALFAFVMMTIGVAASGIASAPAVGGVTVSGSVDGQQLGKSSQIQPVKLFPRQESLMVVDVTNGGSVPITVTKVRLEGQVIGLTFFDYDTSVSMTVAPGATESRRLLIDLSGLDGQATGLIPGTVKVLDANRHVLAQQNGVVDVRGSLRSVYGLFGLGVAFLTALSFLGALVGLARHRLTPNRWRRGLRFLTPGLGLGLVINFTLSATRVFVPEIGRWLTITALSAAILFGLGYLTPTPDLEDDEPVEEESRTLVEEITVLAIAARPGHPALPAQPAPPQLSGDGGWPPAVAPVPESPQLEAAAPPPAPVTSPPVPSAPPGSAPDPEVWPEPAWPEPMWPEPPSPQPADEAPLTAATTLITPDPSRDSRATLPAGVTLSDLAPEVVDTAAATHVAPTPAPPAQPAPPAEP